MGRTIPTETKEKLLGFLRKGDFIHPGEEDAIDMAFSGVNKDPARTILDVGCGIGGTASYVQENQYGSVIGIDVSQSVIEYAQAKYLRVNFFCCDVIDAPGKLMPKKFDLILMMNSFFYFQDQLSALKGLKKLAKENTKLIIFEYTDLTNGKDAIKLRGDEGEKNFSPVMPDTIAELLKQSGWNIDRFQELDAEYEKWYANLYEKILLNKAEIVNCFSREAYDWAESIYGGLLQSIKDKEIGGCIIIAKNQPFP